MIARMPPVHTIATPPSDLELGLPRRPLTYAATPPSAGIGPHTGVILYIHGFGSSFDDAYAQKLRAHWADLYDCVAVSVDYHGSSMLPVEVGLERPADDFFLRLAEHHGVTVTAGGGLAVNDIVRNVLGLLASRGVERLHPSCLLLERADEHFSFALLPALDCLAVLHRVLSDHPLDRRRLYALGTSYGGTTALLMTKLAPNTLRLVVDNCGYSRAENVPTIYGRRTRWISGVAVQTWVRPSFSQDPASPHYFTSAHRAIRDLTLAEHFRPPGGSAVYSYHSVEDTVAPCTDKVKAAKAMGASRPFELTVVTRRDLDGRLFKNADHGMNASLRGLFELSYGRWRATAAEVAEATDFDLGTVTALRCADRTYTCRLDHTHGVRLEIGR